MSDCVVWAVWKRIKVWYSCSALIYSLSAQSCCSRFYAIWCFKRFRSSLVKFCWRARCWFTSSISFVQDVFSLVIDWWLCTGITLFWLACMRMYPHCEYFPDNLPCWVLRIQFASFLKSCGSFQPVNKEISTPWWERCIYILEKFHNNDRLCCCRSTKYQFLPT